MSIQKGTYFEETQHYSTAWVWLLVLALQTLLFSFLIFNFDEVGANNFTIKQFYLMWGIFSLMFLGLYILFKTMHLYFKVGNSEIIYQFRPFMKRQKSIKIDEISSYSVREYKAIKEFGGNGYKPNGVNKKAPSYTVSGKYGMEVKFKGGRTIFIGTQRKEALKYAMEKLMQKG